MIEKIKYWLFQKGKDCKRCCLRCRYYDICRWDVLGNAGLQSEETITLLAIENSKPHKDGLLFRILGADGATKMRQITVGIHGKGGEAGIKRAEYGEGYYKKYAAGNGTKYYRVRKSWTDAASQLGAFTSLENAKSACKAGYTVYDDNGKAVYTAVGQQTSAGVPFSVQVDILDLNIRTGAGTNYAKTGETTGKGVFTIVEVKAGQGASAGWGRLKSGAGWISLDYATRLA